MWRHDDVNLQFGSNIVLVNYVILTSKCAWLLYIESENEWGLSMSCRLSKQYGVSYDNFATAITIHTTKILIIQKGLNWSPKSASNKKKSGPTLWQGKVQVFWGVIIYICPLFTVRSSGSNHGFTGQRYPKWGLIRTQSFGGCLNNGKLLRRLFAPPFIQPWLQNTFFTFPAWKGNMPLLFSFITNHSVICGIQKERRKPTNR